MKNPYRHRRFLNLILSLFVVFAVTSLHAPRVWALDPCYDEYEDLALRRVFGEKFQQIIQKESPRLGLNANDFKTATLFQVKGQGEYAEQEIFILTSNGKSWWFAETKKLGIPFRWAEKLDDAKGSAKLLKLAGTVLINHGLQKYYRFDRASQTYAAMSAEQRSTGQVSQRLGASEALEVFKKRFARAIKKIQNEQGTNSLISDDASVYQLNGEGQFKNRKAFVLVHNFTPLFYSSWFGEEGDILKRQIYGSYSTKEGHEALQKFIGSSYDSQPDGGHYEFDRSTGSFVKVNTEIFSAYRAFNEKIKKDLGDEARDFIDGFGKFILDSAGLETLKFTELENGRFVVAHLAQNPQFKIYMFLPADENADSFFFEYMGGQEGPAMDRLRPGWKKAGELGSVFQMNYDRARYFGISARSLLFVRPDNQYLVYGQLEQGRLPRFIKFIDAPKFNEIKADLMAKDQTAGPGEGGAYADFIEHHLNDFILSKEFAAGNFEGLRSFEILGEGHPLKHPEKRFTVFKFAGNTYYLGITKGKKYFGKYRWTDNENVKDKYFAPEYEDHFLYGNFGPKVVLPSGKVLTMERQFKTGWWRYSIADAPGNLTDELNNFIDIKDND